MSSTRLQHALRVCGFVVAAFISAPILVGIITRSVQLANVGRPVQCQYTHSYGVAFGSCTQYASDWEIGGASYTAPTYVTVCQAHDSARVLSWLDNRMAERSTCYLIAGVVSYDLNDMHATVDERGVLIFWFVWSGVTSILFLLAAMSGEYPQSTRCRWSAAFVLSIIFASVTVIGVSTYMVTHGRYSRIVSFGPQNCTVVGFDTVDDAASGVLGSGDTIAITPLWQVESIGITRGSDVFTWPQGRQIVPLLPTVIPAARTCYIDLETLDPVQFRIKEPSPISIIIGYISAYLWSMTIVILFTVSAC